ncbi:MAG: polysaccharide deacetylase family protein [Eubacteriales bacterium]|nr:polysaccharide deacetylase family protein [Eubacteriales bacterium]
MRIFVVKKSTIIRAAVFILLVVGAIVYTQVALVDAAPVSSQSESMPICSVDTDEKVVALTFDTAFGDMDYTAEILDVLDEESVRATFFVMGLWANEYPDKLDDILTGGQEIANHSMDHVRYPDLSTSEILADAGEAADLIFDMTGYDTRLIRMPYGAFDTESILALESEGYIPIKWSLDSKDWKGYDAEKVVNGVLSEVKSGDIIMFQNNMAATPEALQEIILGLREQGYKIVTVSDLLLDSAYIVDGNGTQRLVEE